MAHSLSRRSVNYQLVEVTQNSELWSGGDPVRPELSVEFRTAPGRGVYGLVEGDTFLAFLCYAKTTAVPEDTDQLDNLTSEMGSIVIPYTVWSLQKGCGRIIIQKVLDMARGSNSIDRVVTLSPKTEMARNFHIKNNAFELRVNKTTVNFEYPL